MAKAAPAKGSGRDGGPGGDARTTLARESAGRYRTRDGRFVVEQDSGRWLVVDAEQADELGLPRVRGPFATLDAARAAIAAARAEPRAPSPLEPRLPATGKLPAERQRATASKSPPARTPPAESRGQQLPRAAARAARAAVPGAPLEIRRLRAGDEAVLRRIAEESGAFDAEPDLAGLAGHDPLADLGDPDESAPARPGDPALLTGPGVLAFVALDGDRPVGYVVGHVLPRRRGGAALLVDEAAVLRGRRRTGIARRLFEALWSSARERGIERAFALPDTWNGGAAAFYRAIGGVRAEADRALFRFDLPPHR